MNAYRVRIYLTESRFMDTIVHADSWYNAQSLGEGQSPVGLAIFLGDA